MRKIYAIILIGCLGFSLKQSPLLYGDSSPDLLARFHFAGAAALSADTNAAKLATIAALPATQAVREQILQKLARMPQALFRNYFDTAGQEVSALIRPLWEDLIQCESYGEICRTSQGGREFILAVRLQEAQAQLWQTNLWMTLDRWQAGSLTSYTAPEGSGWEAKFNRVTGCARFVRAGSWCVLSVGQAPLPNLTRLLQQIKKYRNPPVGDGEAWFDAYVDWARLVPGWQLGPRSQGKRSALPVMELSLSSQADYVRSKASLRFANDQKWSTEPWLVPTNTIHDPLISFTAIRGTAPWFKACSFLEQLEIKPPPNQLFVWALSQVPFQTFGAMPVQGASNLMDQLSLSLPPLVTTSLGVQSLGEIRWFTNRSELVWSGLPVITPFLQAVSEPQHDYLLAGLFPPSSSTNPPPTELLSQVMGRPNIQYYDWEITQERLVQVWVLSQWYDLLSTSANPDRDLDNANKPARAWLLAIAPQLGNTATEAEAVSPTELVVTRRSHSGFAGLELVLLSRWLDTPQFPLLGYALPAPAKRSPGPKPQP